MSHLLDVNVLIALHDPNHVHHEMAHEWFAAHRGSGWATCPLTINGCVRIMCSPAYMTVSVSVSEMMRRLRALCNAPDHAFWPANVNLADEERFDARLIPDHRQVTDTYLVGLAVHHAGRLATFDRGIPWRAVVGATAEHVEVIGG